MDPVSPERVESLLFRRKDGTVFPLVVRGLETSGIPVHRDVQVKGTFPTRGSRGFVVGQSLVGEYVGFEEGGQIVIGRQAWPTTGCWSPVALNMIRRSGPTGPPSCSSYMCKRPRRSSPSSSPGGRRCSSPT